MQVRFSCLRFFSALVLSALLVSVTTCLSAADAVAASPETAPHLSPPLAYPPMPSPAEPATRPDADPPISALAEKPVLFWNTFHGSSAALDEARAVAVDAAGNVYVTGFSNASWGAPLNSYTAYSDVFVAKLNSIGVLQWNTFMGGAYYDYSHAIAVDQAGNIYVAGESDTGWGAPLRGHAGNLDAFIAKLDKNGNRLWHTFLGSNGNDYGYDLVLTGNGAIYLVGNSDSSWGDNIVNPHAGGTANDAFLAKLTSAGNLQWNTFMGSTGSSDYGNAVAVDGSGTVFVAGTSISTWGSNPVNPHSGYYDAFVAQFNGSTGARQKHTFISGYGVGRTGEGIALNDTAGKVYAGGIYNSTTVWVTKFVSSTLVAESAEAVCSSCYFGDIDLDAEGRVYIAGRSLAWGAPLNPHAGGFDAFVARFNSALGYEWHTFLGSSVGDYGYGMDVSTYGVIHLAGTSYNTWGQPVNPFTGAGDAFAARLCDLVAPSKVTIAGPTVGVTDTVYSFIASASPLTATTPITYVWQATDQDTITHTANLSDSVSFTWVVPGGKEVAVAATNISGTVTNTHTISLAEAAAYDCYLPVTLKNFFCDEYEPNNSRPKNGGSPPGPFLPGQTIQSQICLGDPRDLYYADLTAGLVVTLTLTGVPLNANFDLYLWDENSDVLKARSEKAAGLDEQIIYAVPVTGRYYVDVYPKQGVGSYLLHRG